MRKDRESARVLNECCLHFYGGERNANWHGKWTENGLTKWTNRPTQWLPGWLWTGIFATHMPGGRNPFAVASEQMLFIKPKPRHNNSSNNNNWLVTVAQKAETKLPHR